MPATEVTEVFFETFAGIGQDYGSIGSAPLLQVILTFDHFNILLSDLPAPVRKYGVRYGLNPLARLLGYQPTYPMYSTLP